jgi:Domain of unknown function (DUF4349)
MRKMLLAVVLSILVAVVSCSKRESVAESKERATEAMNVATDTAATTDTSAADAAAGVGRIASVAPKSPVSPLPATRMIVRKANLSLVVSDAAKASAAIAQQAAAFGGYVADSRTWRENEQVRATLTVRVPAQNLDAMLASARKGSVRVQNETVSGEDVTQEFSDLGARLRNAEAAEVELRELLTTVRQRTQKAKEILEIYEKLNEVRGEIEEAKGRMLYLNQVTAMSTVTVELIPDAIAQPVVEPGWRPVAVIRDATRSLVIALKWIANVAIWLVIWLLPLVLLVTLILWVMKVFGERLIRALSKPPTAGGA